MKMKKTICLLLAAAIGVSALAACGKETADETATQSETAAYVDEGGQNPVMNFIGNYQSDRCTLLLEADGDSGARVTAHQANDPALATDATEWELTGDFDETSMRITYDNAVKKLVSYTEAGAISGESVVYQNGSGYIRVNDDGTLTWHDNNDPELASKTFMYLAQTEPAQPEETQPTAVPAAASTAAPATVTNAAAAATAKATTTRPATPTKPTTTTKPATTSTTHTTTGDDGQNPVMNFAGTYQSGRCSLTITPDGKDGATITATWGNSADCASKWIMHAAFDPDTLRLTYADSTKTTSTYDENGNVVSQTVDYTDGSGRLQLFGDGTLRGEDENEADSLVGMTFSAN